jgi:hypothetical protein
MATQVIGTANASNLDRCRRFGESSAFQNDDGRGGGAGNKRASINSGDGGKGRFRDPPPTGLVVVGVPVGVP